MAPERQTMDFFESQSQALRRTAYLVFLFCIAVVLIVLVLYIAVAGLFAIQFDGRELPFIQKLFHPKLFLWVGGVTILVILAGTVAKIIELRQGGSAVAFMLGGVPVPLDSDDPDERKLLNVVDEMALASGCPLPSVFVLRRETGINAFAAGFSPSDAAIAVTQGCIALLDRDELQGVIAHEFSHIVRGDMRLNIKLIGILNGILLIGVTGGVLLRASFFTGDSRRRSRGNDRDGGGALFIVVLGIVLIVVGYIGVFFGKMIKAAVSRQREYLADAAAVQYTRNPRGLSGALQKIGGLTGHAIIKNPHAEEASHLFFGNALRMKLAALSTHPPIAERIKAINPAWDGTMPKITGIAPHDEFYGPIQQVERKPVQSSPPPVRPIGFPIPPIVHAPGHETLQNLQSASPSQVINQVGTISPESIAFAGALLESLPTDLRQKCRRPNEAKIVILALFMEKEKEGREKELAYLSQKVNPALCRQVEAVLAQLDQLDARARLPLMDLSMPALRQLGDDEKEHLLDIVEGVINADQEVKLFEFALERLLVTGLHGAPRGAQQYHSISALKMEIGTLLSAVAFAGNEDETKARDCYVTGAKRFGDTGEQMPYIPRGNCKLEAVGQALDRLALANPHIKRAVLEACASCIIADKEILVSEAELLRAISASLDCPMPPILN